MGSFTKAVRQKLKLRMAIAGPSGSGKTFTALSIASGMGLRVALIDTEFSSALRYAPDVPGKLEPGEFDFDHVNLSNHDPLEYCRLIKEAQLDHDVLIIDSLSHAWCGSGGALEQVDNEAARSRSGNSYTAWRNVTPKHNALVNAMLACQCHLIACIRSKQDYVQSKDERGKTTIEKVGMAPVQREGLEYEFDIFADMNMGHQFIVSKTRCRDLDGKVLHMPGKALGEQLLAWTDGGVDIPPKTPATTMPPVIRGLLVSLGAKTAADATAIITFCTFGNFSTAADVAESEIVVKTYIEQMMALVGHDKVLYLATATRPSDGVWQMLKDTGCSCAEDALGVIRHVTMDACQSLEEALTKQELAIRPNLATASQSCHPGVLLSNGRNHGKSVAS